MPDRSDIVYRYDGSFTGLMCCVFESFHRREMPLCIVGPKEEQTTLFEVRDIISDGGKSDRVTRAIADKISEAALNFVYHAFLTNLQDREVHILHFLYLGFKYGGRVMRMLTNDTVSILNKAVTHLSNEAALLRGFVRFSEFGGGLVATIEPKNNVLPLLRSHFMSRYPDGCFMIYDKTHKLILFAQNGRSRIVQVEDFVPPPAEADEARYRALWKRFYDTIAVEGRENPRCRMTHMPKRYWKYMTEMQEQGDMAALTGKSGLALTDGKPL